MATIKGSNDIYASINVLDDAREYGATTQRAGQKYYIGQWNGRGFTCSEEFYKAFKAGELQQVTLTETVYKRIDPVTNVEVERPSATLGGFLTKSQSISMLRGDKDLMVAQAQLDATTKVAGKIAERQAYAEAGLDAATTKELMALAV
jgi:hypothetical protein